MSTLTHPLQHNSGKDHDRCLRRSWRHCQHWRQNNYQSPFCWWHLWLNRRGRRTGKIRWASQQSLHSLQNGNQCQADPVDDNTSDVNKEVKVNRKKLETVRSFKYLGSVASDKCSKPEILSRIAKTTAVLTKLKPVWNKRSIFLCSNKWLMRSLVTSSSWMLVNHEPSQQSCKEEYEPWKWSATTWY